MNHLLPYGNSRFQIPDSKSQNPAPRTQHLAPTSGFTLIELIMVMGLFSLLTAFASINLLRPQTQASLDGVVISLVSNMRQQQLKAMAGDTDGTAQAQPFGVRFNSNNYILFRGASFNPSEPTNFTVTIEGDVSLTTNLPSSQVIFSRQSGEVAGFTAGSNTVTITNNTNGENKVISINRLGVVTVN